MGIFSLIHEADPILSDLQFVNYVNEFINTPIAISY